MTLQKSLQNADSENFEADLVIFSALDLQYVDDPGYNRARGSAAVLGGRFGFDLRPGSLVLGMVRVLVVLGRFDLEY